MKKLLIISFFWAIAIESYSQLKYFLPDSNSYFSVSSYKFWFQGDTVIDNKKYKKVFQQTGDSVANFKNATYYASVREDTLGEKIYCIQKDDGIERLISDFSLNVGDTVSVYSFWPFETPNKVNIKIKNIDSIFINDNYRRRLNIDETQGCLGEGESWIEGIGSTQGLFFPYSVYPDLGCTELLCVIINDTLYYKNPNYEYCYKNILLGIKENVKDFFKIYPTPARNYLNVEIEENLRNNFQYYVYNTQGIIVKKGILPHDFIDISLLNEGLYFIALYNKNTPILYVKKFVKL